MCRRPAFKLDAAFSCTVLQKNYLKLFFRFNDIKFSSLFVILIQLEKNVHKFLHWNKACEFHAYLECGNVNIIHNFNWSWRYLAIFAIVLKPYTTYMISYSLEIGHSIYKFTMEWHSVKYNNPPHTHTHCTCNYLWISLHGRDTLDNGLAAGTFAAWVFYTCLCQGRSSCSLAKGWQGHFHISSVKFLIKISLKSQWEYRFPHEDNNIQPCSIMKSSKCVWGEFSFHLTVRCLIE